MCNEMRRASNDYREPIIGARENGGKAPDRHIGSSVAGERRPPSLVKHLPAQSAAALPAGTLHPREQGFPSRVPCESWILTFWIVTRRRDGRGFRCFHSAAHRTEINLSLSFPCPEHLVPPFLPVHAAHW